MTVLSPFRDPEAGRVGGSVAAGRLPRLLLAVSGYLRMLRAALDHTREPDVRLLAQFHVYQPATAVAFLAARLSGRPVVAAADHIIPGSYRSPAEGVMNRLLFRAYARILRHPATWTLVSSPEWRETALALGLPGARVRVLPDNVTPRPAPEPEAVRRVRSAHGLEGHRVVLKFGSFTQGGTATFVEAIRRLDRPDVKGVVLADPAWAAAYRREAARRGVEDRLLVLSTQPRETVDAFLALADACVGLLSDHPMARGSLPRNTLEAMAAGKPAVLVRGVVSSTLAEDERTCLLVPPEDPEALTRAIRRLLDDPLLAAALGQASRRVVRDRFQSDVVAAELEAFLETLPDARP